jgi:hypothetical protein
MAFQITYNKTALEIDPVEHLIWAYGMIRPNVHAWDLLDMHYRAGHLKLDFSKEAAPPPQPGDKSTPPPTSNNDMNGDHYHDESIDVSEGQSNDVFTDDDVPWGNHEKLIAAHAVLLAVGFLVFLPAGSLIARWTRTFTPKWFQAHSLINMTFTLPVVVIGWLLGPMAVIGHDDNHFATPHRVSLEDSAYVAIDDSD